MPFYQKRGSIPAKRHIVHPRTDGDGMYFEELVGNEGFTGASSLIYHLGRPTRMLKAELLKPLNWSAESSKPLQPRHFRLGDLDKGGDPGLDRTPILFNSDVALSASRPAPGKSVLYRNSQGDEVIYVAQGSGRLESVYGDLDFAEGDYLVIPRGIIHRYSLDDGPSFFFNIESRGVVRVPRRYRNSYGQFLEGAPFCERDIRTPQNLNPQDDGGEFELITKMHDGFTRHVMQGHPFDAVGWDGSYFPWAFNIRDFEPIVGRIHQPPPVHQTFQGDGFVICSFVPRLYDFDPQAIPAPYHHTNAQTDEVLFYASEEFMSRKGISFGSLTYHPDGIVHGPHPGRAEASIGQKATDELAVMVDTFKPMHVAEGLGACEDAEYIKSWLD